MARSVVAIASPAINSGATTITKDAMDSTNNHSIDVSTIQDQNLVILIETDSTVANTIEVKAGDYEDSVLGDLTITSSAVSSYSIVLESSRFKDSDGLILIDVSGTNGTISAINSPI